jgi:hypothetical protein
VEEVHVFEVASYLCTENVSVFPVPPGRFGANAQAADPSLLIPRAFGVLLGMALFTCVAVTGVVPDIEPTARALRIPVLPLPNWTL